MISKIFTLVFLIMTLSLFSEESFQLDDDAKKINQKLYSLKTDLSQKINDVSTLYYNKASESDFGNLLNEIKQIRKEICDLQEEFRKNFLADGMKNDEGYAFWDQGETTISQLIMEYGSQDYLYVIPNELASMKINIFSTIAIPHQSWDDILQLILSYNGIGVKKINPFLRQLYILKHDPSHIEAIINKPQDLHLTQEGSTICYIFSPKPEDVKSVLGFFERFSDLKQTTVHPVRTDIIVIGSKENISRLINLYEAVYNKSEGKVVKVLSLSKIASSEADKILQTFFSQTQKNRPTFYQGSIEELSIIAQGSSLVLIGEAALVERAENVLLDLEKQLDDPSEMTIFWYSCKNSDPQELADILEKIYSSMLSSNVRLDEKKRGEIQNPLIKIDNAAIARQRSFEANTPFNEKTSSKSDNFVVDAKTGSILMVVRKDELDKLKILLKKLDQPKKMVQIDVLLVERKVQDKKQTGINLLKIGNAGKKKETEISFDDSYSSKRKGLLDLIISRSATKLLPSFDLTLSFLMAQEDMRLADCPSVLAINQTPATISVVDEISINNGAVQVDSSSGARYEKSYTRSKFGTTIVMTPTIHTMDDEDGSADGFVTLHTDVSFDTIKSKDNDKPAVTSRHIENEVRVADGQTIILGGLRRKTGSSDSEKIPFLGEIPGIGKLFGTTKQENSSSEMFIFITPHIIKDSKIDFDKQKKFDLQKRQGDLDDFLEKLEFAKALEKKKIFEKSIKLFFENEK